MKKIFFVLFVMCLLIPTTSLATEVTSLPEVTSLQAENLDNQVKLTWTNPKSSTYKYLYSIAYRYEDFLGGYAKLGSRITDGDYTDSDSTISNGETIKYMVTSVYEVDGKTIESAGAFVTGNPVDEVPPHDVRNLTYNKSSTTVLFQYELPKNTDFDHVNVYRNNSKITSIKTATYSVPIFTDRTVYKFTTVDTKGNESTGVSIDVNMPTLGEISELTLDPIDSMTVRFDWVLPKDTEGRYSHINIYRNGILLKHEGTITGTTYTDNYTGPEIYTYVFKVVDEDGTQSRGITVEYDSRNQIIKGTSASFMDPFFDGVTNIFKGITEVIGTGYDTVQATADYIEGINFQTLGINEYVVDYLAYTRYYLGVRNYGLLIGFLYVGVGMAFQKSILKGIMTILEILNSFNVVSLLRRWKK